MLPNPSKPLHHQQCPPDMKRTLNTHPPRSPMIVDEISSEAIDHGQPQDVHDDVPTATHPTFVTDTNS